MTSAMPQRKRMRLARWDYSSAAWYFVTISCKGHRKLFGEVVDEHGVPVRVLPNTSETSLSACSVELSFAGRACRDVLEETLGAPGSAHVVDYVVMPGAWAFPNKV